ncbi:hypothetical protein NKH16_19975 [Mesorhizobium sp. M1307]|uniref:hypothetical protein n=1 Tax=Mesorhizobium sp. M1307 TaxID=2957079 RepID=UPI00333AF9A1
MKFQYFEIRPCVDFGDHIESYLGEPEFIATIGDKACTPEGAEREAEQRRAAAGITKPVFWTIYGRDEEGLAMAVGDFTTFADADEIMNAILAPMAEARDLIRDGDDGRTDAETAANNLDDFVNQCSNSDRI